MRPDTRILTCLIVLATVSCAVVGKHISDDQIEQLRLGMTMAEVREILGRPTMDMPFPDGTRHWQYIYSRATSVILVTSVESETIEVIFKDAKLVEVPGYELRGAEAGTAGGSRRTARGLRSGP